MDTSTQQPGILATVQPRAQKKSGKGIFIDAWEGLFGEHDRHAAAIKAMRRHGAGFRNFAHTFSYIMLVMFSAQGVLAQVSDDAKAVWSAIQSGHAPDFNKLLTVLIVVVFNIGLDIALIAMFEEIRYKRGQGEKWPSPGGPYTFVIIGSFVEAATYLVVVLGIHNWLVTLFLLILRAGVLPFVVNVLATLAERAMTHKDYKQSRAVQLSLYVDDYHHELFRNLDIHDIDGGALISAYASAVDLTPEEAQQMINQADAVARLNRNSMQVRNEEENAKIHAAYQQQLSQHTTENARLNERVSAMESAVNDARMAAHTARHEAALQADSEMGNTLQKLLLSLAYQHTIPADIIERYPELSSLNVEGLFTQSRGHSRNNAGAKVAKETPENAEGQRAFLRRILQDSEIKGATIGTPTSRKGVWITPAVVSVLSGGKVNESTAHTIVKTLNKGDKTAKIGTSNAAPFVDVMRHLAGLGALSDEARIFWQSTDDSAEDTQEMDIA